MDIAKLKQAEHDFFIEYPEGFESPEMAAIGKKHRMPQMVELCQSTFNKAAFEDPNQVVEDMVKVIGRSSMVSMFEKPKFRDFARSLSADDKAFMSKSLYQLLLGKMSLGFEGLTELLKTGKLAKWSLLTVIPAYFAPLQEVFVKPTTAKNVINYFEIAHLTYRPQPTWDFYTGYRDLIHEMKTQVDPRLAPSNAAFSGFLMMTVKV